MTVITFSRQLGARGEEIAAGVAQRLGLRLIDAETINRAAQRAGVPQMALTELIHEGERSLANQVLKALRTMPNLRGPYPVQFQEPDAASTADPAPVAPRSGDVSKTTYGGLSGLAIPFTGLFSPTVPPISASLEEYVRMVGLVIRGLAREGNVLIVGRGGQTLLKNHPDALHVQVVAPFNDRVEAIMVREDLNRRAAQNRVRASDRARFDYVRRYHDADWLDSTLYHLVLNTARLPLAVAIQLVCDSQRALADRSDAAEVDG
jgi:cytidylate kinase